MAFTNYLDAIPDLGWLFYGVWRGLSAELGVTAALAIGIGVYFLQVAFSAVWLPAVPLWAGLNGCGASSCMEHGNPSGVRGKCRCRVVSVAAN